MRKNQNIEIKHEYLSPPIKKEKEVLSRPKLFFFVHQNSSVNKYNMDYGQLL
jgi:hypothetical protein